MTERVKHDILADSGYQVARFVEVFMLSRFGRHIGNFADIYKVLYTQLELEILSGTD